MSGLARTSDSPDAETESETQGAKVGATPVLSIEDFVLGDRARFDSVEYIAVRMVFLVFVLIAAATLVIEVVRFAAHG